MTGPARLTVAGVATVGSAYGMARYGFGLLLPDMRAALRLSVAAIGATAAAVAVAGASAALVFPPFADAIADVVPAPGRARALGWISSGTGAGVAVAAPLA